jgi:hypothetical protein
VGDCPDLRLPKGWDKLTLPEPLAVPKGRSAITLRLLKPDNAKLKSLELVNLVSRDDIQRRIRQLRAPTTWLRDAKYGLMFQWGGWGYPPHGPKKPWPTMIDDFDVETFARMAEDAGAGYVIWSLTWGINHPETKISRPCLSPEQAVELVKRATARGQTLSFNLLMYEDGSESPDSLEVMRAVRKAVRGR